MTNYIKPYFHMKSSQLKAQLPTSSELGLDFLSTNKNYKVVGNARSPASRKR